MLTFEEYLKRDHTDHIISTVTWALKLRFPEIKDLEVREGPTEGTLIVSYLGADQEEVGEFLRKLKENDL